MTGAVITLLIVFIAIAGVNALFAHDNARMARKNRDFLSRICARSTAQIISDCLTMPDLIADVLAHFAELADDPTSDVRVLYCA